MKSKNIAGYNLVGESMGFSFLKSTRCNHFQVRGMPVKRETDMKPGMKREMKRGGCETIADRVSDLNTFLGDYVGDVYVPPLT
jgi:hypothetical protein